MKKKIKYNSYGGMGFIESLIAIMVVGVASVVLMRIAASTMSDAVENERIDKMTQYAVEGANMAENIVQEFYEYPTSSDAISFFDKIALSFPTNIKCFVPETIGNPQVYQFKKDVSLQFIAIQISSLTIESINNHKDDFPRAEIMTNNVGSGFFRYACFYPYTASTDKQINVGIVVGHLASEGTYTARRNVKHYIYSTVIPLR